MDMKAVLCADPLIAILDDPASDFADREHYQKDWLGVQPPPLMLLHHTHTSSGNLLLVCWCVDSTSQA